MTPPKSVLIMNFGPRRARTVELANALAVAGVETTLLTLGPTTWMLPGEITLDRRVHVEFLVDYLQECRWESWRPKLATALKRGAQVRRFGVLGGVVRRNSRLGQEALAWANRTLRPLLLADSAMRCLSENQISDPDAVVATSAQSLPAADTWARSHPGKPVLVGRHLDGTLRDLGFEPTDTGVTRTLPT
ncbi:MAG: hypothetical protein U0904_00100 [Candidatus Nanopelagicales bacterium]|nr:hypothetical protein [Candidatus Nanopelagicales bacterium]